MPVGMENRTLGDLSIFLMWAVKNEQSLNPRFLLWIKGQIIGKLGSFQEGSFNFGYIKFEMPVLSGGD